MRIPLYLLLVVSTLASAQEETGPPPPVLRAATDTAPLPGTEPLTWEGDLADRMISGVDSFLLQKIEGSREGRQPDRDRLRDILGLTRDQRPEQNVIEYVDTLEGPRAEGEGFRINQVRWRAFRDVYGTGLFLQPNGQAVATVILIPDADETPEEHAGMPPWEGLVPRVLPSALALVRAGCEVLVPQLINREDNQFHMSNREFLHRSAWELGRTLIGYELQKVLAAADCLEKKSIPLGVMGWGEGGRLALYAGAVDDRFDASCASGYFAPRQEVWKEPADRTVFGLLDHFGDAEIAQLHGERPLILEYSTYPKWGYRIDASGEPEVLEERVTGKPGKPGKLIVPTHEEFLAEAARIPESVPVEELKTDYPLALETLHRFLERMDVSTEKLEAVDPLGVVFDQVVAATGQDWIALRQEAQIHEIDRHNQWALLDAARVRAEYWDMLKTDNLENFEKTIEPYRDAFRDEVIGSFDDPLLPLAPRSRPYQEGEGVRSYEVVLDVYPGVFAYGVLTVPEDLPLDGSVKRPVVVCQHGLEGRPQHVIGEEKHGPYKAFATRLAQEGYVTFSPQNPYLFTDRFRTLQFKANAVGTTLFSVIVPQHQQITDWLADQPFVDADRIGFYGLSYGGKSAMRIPPLVDRYALSICSADFNEWIWKNAATDPRSLRYSYANKGEYEIFEFNLGNTFNYAEMAALICPRPFMVERGHFDGVGPDEAVAYEFAKVRNLYAARLKIPDRTEIEWFPGPHSINLKGTLNFLNKWLGDPASAE